MSDEELRDQYELFVLGVADREAAEEIEARLAAGDKETIRGVEKARELVSGLALTAPEVEPPARLKKRVLSAVRTEPMGFPRLQWAWAAATALALLVAVNFWQREQAKQSELTEVRAMLQASDTRVQSAEARLQTVSQLLDFLNEPQLRIASFGLAQPQPPKGRVLVSPSRGVMLLVSNLPPAPQGRTYQMWVVPKKGAPASAGVFQTGGDGQAIHVNARTVDLAVTNAVAVTVEPEGGSPGPTTTPFIAVPVGG